MALSPLGLLKVTNSFKNTLNSHSCPSVSTAVVCLLLYISLLLYIKCYNATFTYFQAAAEYLCKQLKTVLFPLFFLSLLLLKCFENKHCTNNWQSPLLSSEYSLSAIHPATRHNIPEETSTFTNYLKLAQTCTLTPTLVFAFFFSLTSLLCT
jgi:hypothetical protein